MQRTKLTTTKIEKLEVRQKPYFVWDTDVPNLAVKVQPSGYKSWALQYTINGFKPRKTIAPTMKLSPHTARQIAKKWNGLIAQGIDPRDFAAMKKEEAVASKAAGFTVGDLLDKFMAEHSVIENKLTTIDRNRSRINGTIRPHLGAIRLIDLSESDLQSFKREVSSTPSQFNHCRALLSKALNLAVQKWKLIDNSPISNVTPYGTAKQTRYLSQSEYAAMLEAAKTIENKLYEEGRDASSIWAVQALLYRGLRISEIINLRWKDLDRQANRINLPDSKVGFITMPMGPNFRDLINKIADCSHTLASSSDYIFPSPTKMGSGISYSSTYARFKQVAQAANISGVSPHTSRSTIATQLADGNASSFAIQSAMGWKTVQMAERYVKNANVAAQHALEELDLKLG